MACGSGQMLADIIANQQTAIASDDYALNRYNNVGVKRPHVGADLKLGAEI